MWEIRQQKAKKICLKRIEWETEINYELEKSEDAASIRNSKTSLHITPLQSQHLNQFKSEVRNEGVRLYIQEAIGMLKESSVWTGW